MTTFLDYASSKYYSGSPIMTDDEFDKLAEYYDYSSVGAAVTSNGISHAFPMYSLQKCYDDEDPITLPGTIVSSPKLDGAAVALYYISGILRLALTRGDGKQGLDITEKMKTLVPNQISSTNPIVQITGEVVAPKSIPNSRNYAAGALNLKSLSEFNQRDLIFVAYGMQLSVAKSWTEDMLFLNNNQFTVITDTKDFASIYPTDGVVFRVNENSIFQELGHTAKHPRGAYALKHRKEGVITRLLNVDWQVGRSGVVSPVALLEPVVIGEATVSRATLHNIKYIQELDLEIGCLVEVVRSGEIIPKVVRRVYE
jgi:DNA ligase (NAD+)